MTPTATQGHEGCGPVPPTFSRKTGGPHEGRRCFGKAPMQTFLDALPIAKEKLMAA